MQEIRASPPLSRGSASGSPSRATQLSLTSVREANQFLGPLRIFLVSLEGDDRAQVKLGKLGTPGKFGTPRILRFDVPDVPAGEYTVAIWFKGYATGTWANALEGINPLLTIRAADKGAACSAQSDGQTITIGGLGVGLIAWGWRRAARRAASTTATRRSSAAHASSGNHTPSRISSRPDSSFASRHARISVGVTRRYT